MRKTFTTFFLLLFLAATVYIARGFRVDQIPNGSKFVCSNCHINPNGGGTRTAFGNNIGSSYLDGNGNVQWGPDIAAIDSDGDGFTNGEELQDPNGTWKIGDPAPGDPSKVTNPGDPNSKPDPTGINDEPLSASEYLLYNNYPNPFNPSTNISFSLPRAEEIKIKIYDSIGNLVDVLTDGFYSKGFHTIKWNSNSNGINISSGIYFYSMETSGKTITKRMILLK